MYPASDSVFNVNTCSSYLQIIMFTRVQQEVILRNGCGWHNLIPAFLAKKPVVKLPKQHNEEGNLAYSIFILCPVLIYLEKCISYYYFHITSFFNPT